MGIAIHHTYRVITRETFKGQALSEFTLYNPNNSARFDMDIGKTYLVFVIALGGRSVIDSCGWSDPLSAATNTLLKVRSLSATTRPQTSP